MVTDSQDALMGSLCPCSKLFLWIARLLTAHCSAVLGCSKTNVNRQHLNALGVPLFGELSFFNDLTVQEFGLYKLGRRLKKRLIDAEERGQFDFLALLLSESLYSGLPS